MEIIQKEPKSGCVTITSTGTNVTVLFTPCEVDGHSSDAYYFPLGIVGLCIKASGGVPVIYVYNSSEMYPHLTIPFDNNVHYTSSRGENSYEVGGWHVEFQRFYKLYSLSRDEKK